MATEAIAPKELKMADFKGRVDPDWCPGCGDYGVLAAVQKALVELQIPNHEVVTISGIGCSSNFPGFIETYGMHTLHGRSLAVATGMKMANHGMTVLVTGGDGDGFGIGGNHFMHTMRRNVDLTYIVMDNQIYGLTTGQCSPTSVKGMKTKSTPHGNVENPINPIPMAIVGGATYVARAFSGKQRHMVDLFKGAIQHKGFALVDVFSPCVTYNKDNIYRIEQYPENQIPPDRVVVMNQYGETALDLRRKEGIWDFNGDFYHGPWHIVATPQGTVINPTTPHV